MLFGQKKALDDEYFDIVYNKFNMEKTIYWLYNGGKGGSGICLIGIWPLEL